MLHSPQFWTGIAIGLFAGAFLGVLFLSIVAMAKD
jgi:hypothetical protein